MEKKSATLNKTPQKALNRSLGSPSNMVGPNSPQPPPFKTPNPPFWQQKRQTGNTDVQVAPA